MEQNHQQPVPPPADVQKAAQAVQRARQLAAQAEKLAEQVDRQFTGLQAELESCVQQLQRQGNQAGLRQVRADLDAFCRGVEEDALRLQQALQPARPVTRRVAMRTGRI